MRRTPNRYMLPLYIAVLAVVLPALGEEIVVKNDSVVDFGQAYIVGDFIAGEHAGARLTSPCDGVIVAVQILWLEGTPGHPQSLEEAIHIFDGGGFPTPGSELEILEGPVMTPGYLNEFRYLDEAQTLLLNVPVTAGQNFYITLEFANPTDVGNGGPSVVRDVDGCQAGRNVLYGNIGAGWQWYNFCVFLGGDLAIRAVIDCPGTTGACCYTNGNCAEEIEQDDCEAEFGAAWYEGLTCNDITCAARGACCRMGGCLQLVEQNDCEAIDGVYAGDGADCDDDVCVAGACCFGDGSCELLFEFECLTADGEFQGHGTTCDPNPCPQPTGACCFGEICIEDQTEEECTGAGGQWAGPWTDCTDYNGNGIPDACEESCPNPGDSVNYCGADIDGSGDCIVNLADLAQLLANYGMTTGATHEDGDLEPPGGDGDIDLADLATLLGQYGDDCN